MQMPVCDVEENAITGARFVMRLQKYWGFLQWNSNNETLDRGITFVELVVDFELASGTKNSQLRC